MFTRWYPNRPLKLGISTSIGWNWMKAPGPAKLGSKLCFHSVSHGDFKIDTWLVVYLPLWKILVKWDDEIPNIWEKNMFQTTNQLFNRSWIVRPPFVMVKFQGSLRSLAWNVSRPAPWRVDTAQPRTSTCSRPLGRRCRQLQSWGD